MLQTILWINFVIIFIIYQLRLVTFFLKIITHVTLIVVKEGSKNNSEKTVKIIILLNFIVFLDMGVWDT